MQFPFFKYRKKHQRNLTNTKIFTLIMWLNPNKKSKPNLFFFSFFISNEKFIKLSKKGSPKYKGSIHLGWNTIKQTNYKHPSKLKPNLTSGYKALPLGRPLHKDSERRFTFIDWCCICHCCGGDNGSSTASLWEGLSVVVFYL